MKIHLVLRVFKNLLFLNPSGSGMKKKLLVTPTGKKKSLLTVGIARYEHKSPVELERCHF